MMMILVFYFDKQNILIKFLKVHFDKQLSWSKHIEITNKLCRGIGILTKLHKYVQERSMKNVFSICLKPCIEYGNLAYVQGKF